MRPDGDALHWCTLYEEATAAGARVVAGQVEFEKANFETSFSYFLDSPEIQGAVKYRGIAKTTCKRVETRHFQAMDKLKSTCTAPHRVLLLLLLLLLLEEGV